jgi:hypothetical protein
MAVLGYPRSGAPDGLPSCDRQPTSRMVQKKELGVLPEGSCPADMVVGPDHDTHPGRPDIPPVGTALAALVIAWLAMAEVISAISL